MRSLKYILFVLALIASAGAWGQYNPSNPAEPGAPVASYTLTLQADPSGGGSFNLNATSSHVAGETFWVQANTASSFTFVEWTLDGEVISPTYRFQYTMPAKDVKLIAHYRYTPSSPAEPSEPNLPAKPIYNNLWLTAVPAAGGSFNIASGNSYEVGASVRLQANPASNFTFVNWTQDGEIISESRTIDYVMLNGADANRLVANFIYTPGSPGEPAEPPAKKIYHRVFLSADPVGGGYFNTESGNQFEEGTQQTFRAYNNEWYTFQNWTRDGEVVSTSSSYTLTIPTEDVTLTAHYTYNYNPGNPGEPGQTTTKHLSVYGMTATGVRSQTVIYPVFLENTEDVYSVTVVVRFPEGFTVNTANVVQAERAAGHTMTVEALGGNAFRFNLTGDQLLSGQNGKIFDVPVTISTECEPDRSYQIVLSNAARINQDGSKEVIKTRSGYIFVQDMKEDGLYAQFTYEKLQGRVQFTNLSADKAISYHWDFGDGTTSTEKNPLHIYAASGYYDVTLTVRGQTGSDAAQMTLLINDESTWVVDGVFFLDTEVKGVRYFSSAADLFTFLSVKPIAGNLRLNVKASEAFSLALTDDYITKLTSIRQQLADGTFTLTIAKNGDGNAPVLNFGTAGSDIDADVVALFVALGQQMVCDDVALQLWGIGFNPSKIPAIEAGQTLLSGETTQSVDFSPVSTDLTFAWTATADAETATGYEAAGTGNIPAMNPTSGSADDVHLIYNIIASYGGNPFVAMTHPMTLRPALEGSFTTMTPANGVELETTSVRLTWDVITNGVYDVYLWDAANERPTTPVAEGITENAYLSQYFCQNGHTYKWQVIARNAVQQMASEVMTFVINILPDLHVTAIHTNGELEAGQTVTIEWTVRNNGAGATGTQGWKDRLWLVPDVYNGTAATNCKLLTTVSNVRALGPGEEYTASVQVTLDEASYGNYYILAAADMNKVTLIDWTAVGGTIVNPYGPPYLFATTDASGNQLREHGEENNRSDNFFYKKVEIAMPQMVETEWQLLMAIYEDDLNSGAGWTNTWNFNVERRTVLTLPGVTILGGHITGIDLHANGLTGTFPARILTLPALRTLNLSNNALSGDLNEAVTTMSSTLESLNVSNNHFEGNIGAVAQKMPALTSLIANDNHLSEVNPMILASVKTLKLGSQTIDRVVTLDLSDLTAETLMAQIPTILTYDHAAHTYKTSIDLLLSTAADNWSAQLSCDGLAITFPWVAEQNDFRGQSGDVVRAGVIDSQRRAEGSTLFVKLLFKAGDANFNGNVDVTDLQAQINFAFEDYKDRAFNFTAANLWTDEVINVQDVVKMVGLLLQINGSDSEGSKQAPHKMSDTVTETMADLYIQDNHIFIKTETPIAAFELTLCGEDVEDVSDDLWRLGFTFKTNHAGSTTRIVGYSMNGAVIPVGCTEICSLYVGDSQITQVVLSDSNAEAVAATIDGTPTDVAELKSAGSGAQQWFDLQGRRVTPPRKRGIYILNGTKIVNK